MGFDDIYDLLLVARGGSISTERWGPMQHHLLDLQPARTVELVGSPPIVIRVEAYGGTEVAPGLLRDVEALAGVPLVELPSRVRDLYLKGDGRFREDGAWWVVWPMERVLRQNVGSWSDGSLDRDLLAIGDDGTGNPFCVPLDGSDRVEKWSWISGGIEATLGQRFDSVSRGVGEPLLGAARAVCTTGVARGRLST